MNELGRLRRAYDSIDEPGQQAVAAARELLLAEIASGDLAGLAGNGRAWLETSAGRQALRRRRWGLVAAAAAILVGALLVTPAFGIGGRLLDLIESSPAGPDLQTPVWSPDGRKIAFLSRGGGHNGPYDNGLYVVNADGSGQRRLTGDARINLGSLLAHLGRTTPAWSPDGRRIAFESGRDGENGLYVVNADGSGRRILTRNGQAPAWSPDGRKIAFFSHLKVYVMNADGSEHRNLTPGAKARGQAFLAWSPDGRKIAFLGDCGDSCHYVYVMNADGSGLRNLTGFRGLVSPRGLASPPAWSPDGRKIAFLSGGDEVYVMNADGSAQRRLTRNPARDADPVWSPDGRKIAFVSERDGNSEVYVMNANGSGQRSLTRNPAPDADPVWSPDGRKIAFVSNRDGTYEVYVMNADGSGQQRLTQPGS
jgi:Tol biopolymer transport system component